jgi:hypothetical protein
MIFTSNTNAKVLHINDLSLEQRLDENETPANKTTTQIAINII